MKISQAHYETLFAVNICFAGANYGIGGINTLFGVFSTALAVYIWRDWRRECYK